MNTSFLLSSKIGNHLQHESYALTENRDIPQAEFKSFVHFIERTFPDRSFANQSSSIQSGYLKKSFICISKSIGVTSLKQKVLNWIYKNEKIAIITEVYSFYVKTHEMKKAILKSTSCAEALSLLEELSDLQNLFEIQNKCYRKFIGEEDFQQLKLNMDESISVVKRMGKQKAINQYEFDYIKNSIEVDLEKIFQEVEQTVETIHTDSASYQQSAMTLVKISSVKKMLKREDVVQRFDEQWILLQKKRLQFLTEGVYNQFFERALVADIQNAIDYHLIPKETDVTELAKKGHVRKKFKKAHDLRIQKYISPNGNDDEHLLARKIAKAEFAHAICVMPILSDKGMNGAKFLKSVTNKYQGVFKGPSLDTESYVKQFFGGFGLIQKSYLHSHKAMDVIGEKAAYLIAKKINSSYLTLAPVSIISYEEIKGAFLVWQKQAKLACEVATQLNSKFTFLPDEINRFQIFAIFDFLIGNLDRHDENWMIQMDGEIVKRIIPIDNANILPTKETGYRKLAPNFNKYSWYLFTIAKIYFTEETKKAIALIDDHFIDQICEEIINDAEIAELMADDPTAASFPSQEAKKLMQNRFAILKEIVEGKIVSPFELAYRD